MNKQYCIKAHALIWLLFSVCTMPPTNLAVMNTQAEDDEATRGTLVPTEQQVPQRKTTLQKALLVFDAGILLALLFNAYLIYYAPAGVAAPATMDLAPTPMGATIVESLTSKKSQ